MAKEAEIQRLTALMGLGESEAGARDAQADLVRRYLVEFGYLDRGAVGGVGFDAGVVGGLRRFQRFHRLVEDGELSSETVGVMVGARCGVGDGVLFRAMLLGGVPCRWEGRGLLRYAFEHGPVGMAGAVAFQAVRHAFATWGWVIPMEFLEVGVGMEADIRISWERAHHGDFNMVGNVVAHAFFPPGCGVDSRQPPLPVHFDGEEHAWAVDGNPDGFDIETVALHEIGHTLGLEHSGSGDAVMGPRAVAGRWLRELTEEDVRAVQLRYGVRVEPPGGRRLVAGVSGGGLEILGEVTAAGGMEFVARLPGEPWLRRPGVVDAPQVSPLGVMELLPRAFGERDLLVFSNERGELLGSVRGVGEDWSEPVYLVRDGRFVDGVHVGCVGVGGTARVRVVFLTVGEGIVWYGVAWGGAVDGPFTWGVEGGVRLGTPVRVCEAPGGRASWAFFVRADGALVVGRLEETAAVEVMVLSEAGEFGPGTEVELVQGEEGTWVFAVGTGGAIWGAHHAPGVGWRVLGAVGEGGAAVPGARLGVSVGVGVVDVCWLRVDGGVCWGVFDGARVRLVDATGAGVCRLWSSMWVMGAGGDRCVVVRAVGGEVVMLRLLVEGRLGVPKPLVEG